MEFVAAFDLRAPAFGTPTREIYAATLDICAWADAIGFDTIGLGEHHASDDGYLPSPIPMAAAIGARTKRIRIRPNVLLAPLYEPVKLAEDLAVLQYICDGRLEIEHAAALPKPLVLVLSGGNIEWDGLAAALA